MKKPFVFDRHQLQAARDKQWEGWRQSVLEGNSNADKKALALAARPLFEASSDFIAFAIENSISHEDLGDTAGQVFANMVSELLLCGLCSCMAGRVVGPIQNAATEFLAVPLEKRHKQSGLVAIAPIREGGNA